MVIVLRTHKEGNDSHPYRCVQMSEKKAITYTAEFKESAVKLPVESDKPATESARELGVNVNTLHTSIAKYHQPKRLPVSLKRAIEHIYDELKRLRKEKPS